MACRAIAREQQQSPREAFLSGVEELIDEIFFDSDVSRQHMSDEAVGELVFPVEDSNHLVFLNDEHGGGRNYSGARHANRLPRKAAFAKEIAGPKDRYDGFFAGFINHSKFHAAVLNVHDRLRGIALREDGFFFLKCVYFSAQPGRVEEQFHIENRDF